MVKTLAWVQGGTPDLSITGREGRVVIALFSSSASVANVVESAEIVQHLGYYPGLPAELKSSSDQNSIAHQTRIQNLIRPEFNKLIRPEFKSSSDQNSISSSDQNPKAHQTRIQ
jgi:hypothetical protein